MPPAELLVDDCRTVVHLSDLWKIGFDLESVHGSVGGNDRFQRQFQRLALGLPLQLFGNKG
jgi:hypothetical protein